jgi:hypothetical protein
VKFRVVALIGLALVAGACAAPGPVKFGGSISEQPADQYDTVRQAWTRKVHITNDYSTAIDADLILLSPEMRGALITRISDMRQFTVVQHDDLAKQHHDDAEKFIDIVANVKAARWEWNDLTAPRSVWTFTLVDDRGDQLGNPDITQYPAKADVVKVLYNAGEAATNSPQAEFIRSYRIRFPKVPPELLGPDTKWVTVRVAGPLGLAEARWISK